MAACTRSLLEELRRAGIEVVDHEPRRAARFESGVFRAVANVRAMVGQRARRWLDAESVRSRTRPAITLRSWLALLNFKANHRKLIVADRERRHADRARHLRQSARCEQRALERRGEIHRRSRGAGRRQRACGRALFRLARPHLRVHARQDSASGRCRRRCGSSFITEEGIRDHCWRRSMRTRNGDTVRIATFYLSDRKVVDALLARRATRRERATDPGSESRCVRPQKDGVPNRPVANELVTESGEQDPGALVSHARRAIPHQARTDHAAAIG